MILRMRTRIHEQESLRRCHTLEQDLSTNFCHDTDHIDRKTKLASDEICW